MQYHNMQIVYYYHGMLTSLTVYFVLILSLSSSDYIKKLSITAHDHFIDCEPHHLISSCVIISEMIMKSMQCMCIDLFLSPIVMVAVSQYHLSISSIPHLVPACNHALLWVSQYRLSISSTPHLVPACSHALLWVSQYHLSISSIPHLVPACSLALLWVYPSITCILPFIR